MCLGSNRPAYAPKLRAQGYLDRSEEARALYLSHKDEPLHDNEAALAAKTP